MVLVTDEPQLGDIRIRVVREDQPESPRHDSNLAVMCCWHRRQRFGDPHEYADPAAAMDDIPEASETLPLFLYDHSGQTMNTTGFSCPWDSGQVGFIYMTHKRFIEETGYATDEEKKTGILGAASKEKCQDMMRGEVATYDRFLQGDIYGYIIEQCVPGDWETIDSCWGFYGTDFDNGMAESIDEEHHEKLKAALENPEP